MKPNHDRNIDELKSARNRRARRNLISLQPPLRVGQTMYYIPRHDIFDEEGNQIEYRVQVIRLYPDNPERVGIRLLAKSSAVFSPPPEELLEDSPTRVVSALSLDRLPFEKAMKEAGAKMDTILSPLLPEVDDSRDDS